VKRINRIIIPLFSKLSAPRSENYYINILTKCNNF